MTKLLGEKAYHSPAHLCESKCMAYPYSKKRNKYLSLARENHSGDVLGEREVEPLLILRIELILYK